jgi:hypothetical protein
MQPASRAEEEPDNFGLSSETMQPASRAEEEPDNFGLSSETMRPASRAVQSVATAFGPVALDQIP